MSGRGVSDGTKLADDLAEDNKRLQEMLHAALRREAEALRRVKHLSELLAECQLTGSVSPSSGTEPEGIVTGSWRRDCWESRAQWEDHDNSGSVQNSQCSDPVNLSPSLVVSPPLLDEDDSFVFPGVMSAPPLSCLSETRETLSTPELDSPPVEDFGHSNQETSGFLAPAIHAIGDIRVERERPPLAVRKTSSPQPSHPLVRGSEQAVLFEDRMKKKRMSVTLGRVSGAAFPRSNNSTPANYRSRAHSLLLPSWLRRKSKSNSATGGNPTTIITHFSNFLEHSSNITPHPLAQYIDRPWYEVCRDTSPTHLDKYRSAVWELFQSETKYLCNQLQPLEQVYKAFLEELQFYGHLIVADVQKIFANLSELVELSVTVASDLFKLFDNRNGNMIAPTNELILAFSMFGHKWNPVYQRFCVNMEQQRGFVRALQQLPEFKEYILVCRRHKIVQRNDLTDFLIAPMQHQCHYQLLLENVLKATSEPSEKSLLTSAIKAFVVALKELQANITAQQRSEEMLELQETLFWPSLSTLCPDSFIPEFLSLDHQPCRGELATPTRQILQRGTLRLMDSRGRHGNEIYAFLFTDLLMLTEPCSKGSRKDMTRRELVQYTVSGQPLFLDSLDVHSLSSSAQTKYCFTVIGRNKFNQLVTAHTLQAPSEQDKEHWVMLIEQAQQNLV